MIANRPRTSSLITRCIEDAVDLFTRVVPQYDASGEVTVETSVLGQITEWMDEERGIGGREASDDAIEFTPLAVLVALYVLIVTARPVSLTRAMEVVVFEMLPEHREAVGMQATLTSSLIADLDAGLEPDADQATVKRGKRARQLIYASFARVFHRITHTFDPSPFRKDKKQRNKELKRIKESSPRIDEATQARNRDRLDLIMNMIVASSVLGLNDSYYKGDIAYDETVLLVKKLARGHGAKDDLKHSGDPDAGFWNGKRKDVAKGDPESTDDHKEQTGFGYGITLIQRACRPYERRSLEIITGIHIGMPLGGATQPVVTGVTMADRFGLTLRKKGRYAIADKGYHRDGLPEFLLDKGYAKVMEFPSNWKKVETLQSISECDSESDEPLVVNGCYLALGSIFCPGTDRALLDRVGRPPVEKFDDDGALTAEYRDSLVAHQQLMDEVLKTQMPIQEGLKPVKSTTGGRPGALEPKPTEWAITVTCPAIAGKVTCANCPFETSESTEEAEILPEVTAAPATDDPARQPIECRQNTTTIRLTATQLKKVLGHTIGTFGHEDMYSTIRSSNERFNGHLKNDGASGMGDGWVQVRGIARVGLVGALAVAFSNRTLIREFEVNHVGTDGRPHYGPREGLRRRRKSVIDKARSEGCLR